jgi:NADH:ubiquinone oxidoreductase subunit E
MVVVIDRHVIESVEGKNKSGASISTLVAGFEAEGLEPRAALKKAAKVLGISRDEAYRHLTAERSQEK